MCVIVCQQVFFCVFMVGFTSFLVYFLCSVPLSFHIPSVQFFPVLIFCSCSSVLPHQLTPVPCLVRLIPSFTSAYITPLYLSKKNLWSMMHWISHIWAHCFMILHAFLCPRCVSLLYCQILFLWKVLLISLSPLFRACISGFKSSFHDQTTWWILMKPPTN